MGAPTVRNPDSKRRSKKGKVPSGLGRGLAGILEVDSAREARTKDASGALSLLLGADAVVTDSDLGIINKIHKFVIDAAVTAMVDGFNAEGAVVASRSVASAGDRSEPLPNLSLRVPPSCNVSSPFMFGLYGQLSQLLDPNAPQPSDGIEQRQLGDTWVWLYRVDGERGVDENEDAEQGPATVAATFRSTRFEQWEIDALSSLLASVAFTLGSNRKQVELRRKLKADTTVTIGQRNADNEIEAHVRCEGAIAGTEPGLAGFVSATASGVDPVMAVATAAATICESDRNVVFAGSSEVAGHTVTIVMMTEAGTRPRLGVAVHEPGDLKGVVEAVLTTTT